MGTSSFFFFFIETGSGNSSELISFRKLTGNETSSVWKGFFPTPIRTYDSKFSVWLHLRRFILFASRISSSTRIQLFGTIVPLSTSKSRFGIDPKLKYLGYLTIKYRFERVPRSSDYDGALGFPCWILVL